MTDKSKIEKDDFHMFIGFVFIAILAFAFLDSFTSSSQVQDNTRTAIIECGKGNVKSVTTTSFTCKN